MTGLTTSPIWMARLRGSLAGAMLVVLVAACDSTSPSTEAALPVDAAPTVPTDSTTPVDTVVAPDSTVPPPSDSTVPPPTDSSATETIPATDGSSFPGITFATFNMPASYLTSVHNGTLLGGPLSPSNIVSVLTETRSKGGRIVIKLCKGGDSFVKDASGNFSLTKWKELVAQYRNVDLEPFIADGTILGHFLIDEPHRAAKWGKVIPQATIEEMAEYSKQLWPGMTTLVRVAPSWLAASPVTYTHLDAGWLQYTAKKGDVTQLVAAEVAAAKQKRLGLIVGLNVMIGGNGSSGIRGVPDGWAMSAAELRTYGNVLLNQGYGCGFYMWNHNTSYFGRTDIKAASAELSAKARSHAKTSCRQ